MAATLLQSASSRGASSRSCSALWADCGCTVATTASAAASTSISNSSTAVAPPEHRLSLAAPSASSLSTQLALPRSAPLIRDEPLAVRAAEERIACNTHVGPHFGPGSGAGLNYNISRMRSQLERLETWKDGPDTDDDDEEERREAAYMPTVRPYNRLMTFG